MDELISEIDMEKALKMFKLNKSPGKDGLTLEFYKAFWTHLKIPKLQSLNYSLKYSTLSFTQKEGIITLIPKKNKPREF